MIRLNPISAAVVLFLGLFGPLPSHAGKQEAELAVMEVLFDFDRLSSEQYMFKSRNSGFVELILDDGVDGKLLYKVVKALEAHPDIKGVLLTSADICP